MGNDHTIEDVEIFSAGVWNGDVFEIDDLKQIVRNFELLKGSIDPPLKFGHDKDQALAGEGDNLIGQNDGDMALGWVESLTVKGKKLLATFRNVPEIVFQAIKHKRYSKVSAEIFFDLIHKGENIGKALKAVALLGADLPAVTDLEDLAVFLTEKKISSHLLTIEGRPFKLATDCGTYKVILSKEFQMAENQDKVQTFSSDERAELESLRTFKIEQEKELRVYKDKTRIKEFTDKRDAILKTLDEEVSKGNVTPALREEFNEAITGQIATYTEGGSIYVPAEKVAEMIATYSDRLPSKETAKDKTEEEKELEASSDASLDFSNAINKLKVEKNVSYAEATQMAKTLHPELFKAYADEKESAKRMN